MQKIDPRYLNPTDIIDSDHPAVRAHGEKTINGSKDPVDKAVKLYYAVRDGIWYDPYYPFYLPEHYRASNVFEERPGILRL